MGELIYDENSLIDDQMYKYDKFLHSRINKYTGDGRTLVTYFNINDKKTTTSLGMETTYAIIGKESPLRFDKITNMILLGMTSLIPEETTTSTTTVRNYDLHGDAFIIPNTIMPRENDFFIIKHINMDHLFRVTQVTQDGLNTDGSYKISYQLYSTSIDDINMLNDNLVCDNLIMDLQTIGGDDLTPIIGKTDYELRSRLISMLDDMISNYKARYYDKIHNCFIYHGNGQSLFDLCGNAFMAKHGLMISDNALNNIILSNNKLNDQRIEMLYEKSPYKWIERDVPLRYLDTFKYHTSKGHNYVDSSFARYGIDIDIIIPNDPWCSSEECDYFFPMDVYNIFNEMLDNRTCEINQCVGCCNRQHCIRSYKLHRYDYISIIHDFIHGKLCSINDLSLLTGDQLFDNVPDRDIYLWTPIIIYIIKHTLKIK